MQILVIGGGGYYGQQVVEGLERLDDVEVSIGGRSAGVPVDLTDPSSLRVLTDFDLVVNCADSIAAPPDAAVVTALQRGAVFFDMGADAQAVQRMMERQPRNWTGTVVLGVGIFPGLSTALLAATANAVESVERLELAVRVSPLSAAGPGTCALMAESLVVPHIWHEDGQWRQGHPLGRGETFRFHWSGERVGSAVTLPDTLFAHALAPGAHVDAFLAPDPAVLRINLWFLAGLLAWAGPLTDLFLWGLTWILEVVRVQVLADVPTPVELTAVANRGQPDEVVRTLGVRRGQQATAAGVVAAVSLWRARTGSSPGLHHVGDLFELEALADEVCRLYPDLGLELS